VEPRDARLLKEISAVGDAALQQLVALPQVELKVEPRRASPGVERSHRQAGQREVLLGRVLQPERDLEERVAAHVTLRVQLLDQLLEG
jgi:hypothetical protein